MQHNFSAPSQQQTVLQPEPPSMALALHDQFGAAADKCSFKGRNAGRSVAHPPLHTQHLQIRKQSQLEQAAVRQFHATDVQLRQAMQLAACRECCEGGAPAIPLRLQVYAAEVRQALRPQCTNAASPALVSMRVPATTASRPVD